MFLSVLFLITGLLGFLTFTVVATQYQWNRKVNFYLLILLIAASFRFFFNGIHVLIPFPIDEKTGMFFRTFGCIIFPCIYLYFKNLIADKKNPSAVHLLHFVFPVLFGCSLFWARENAPFLVLYYYFLFAGIALFYLYLSYRELRDKLWFRKTEKSNVIHQQEVLIQDWAIFFFIVVVLTILRLVITVFFDLWVATYSDGETCLWITAVVACVLFFKILLTDETLFTFAVNKEVKKKLDLVFDDFWILSHAVLVDNADLKLKCVVEEKLLIYLQEIERMVLKQLYFRTPSVSLSDFSARLNIPKSHLIYIFKYHATVSFVEFKRIIQIYDSVDMIDEGYLQSKTLQSLSKKAGFSSYDPFLISFKEITGVVPQEYEKMIK